MNSRTTHHTIMRPLLLLGAALLLGACSLIPTQDPVDQAEMRPIWEQHRIDMLAVQSWTLEGRVGARTGSEGTNFSVYWRQEADDTFSIRISGPLGQGGASITGQPGWVEMQTSDGTFYAESLDQLLAETTTIDLPLGLLRYWVRGIPDPNKPAEIVLDHTPLMDTLSQAGWQVEFRDYYDDTRMPRRLNIEQGEHSARIVIQTWNNLDG